MNTRTSTRNDYEKRMNVIVEYINDHLNEEMDLKRLAEMSNFSIFHFHRIFKGIHQETLAAYITRCRVERAAYLLRYTNLSIETIAFNVGFEFPSSLSKAFKSFYNISPATYRTNRDYTIINQNKMDRESELIMPELVTLANKNVIYIRLVGAYNVLNYPETCERLQNYAKEQNLCLDKMEHIAIYHDDISVTETDKLRSDICLSINKPVPPKGEIGVKQIQGGKYAVFFYEGPFHAMSPIYDQIFAKWLPGSDYEIRDLPIFEKYRCDRGKSPDGKMETEVYLPVQ